MLVERDARREVTARDRVNAWVERVVERFFTKIGGRAAMNAYEKEKAKLAPVIARDRFAGKSESLLRDRANTARARFAQRYRRAVWLDRAIRRLEAKAAQAGPDAKVYLDLSDIQDDAKRTVLGLVTGLNKAQAVRQAAAALKAELASIAPDRTVKPTDEERAAYAEAAQFAQAVHDAAVKSPELSRFPAFHKFIKSSEAKPASGIASAIHDVVVRVVEAYGAKNLEELLSEVPLESVISDVRDGLNRDQRLADLARALEAEDWQDVKTGAPTKLTADVVRDTEADTRQAVQSHKVVLTWQDNTGGSLIYSVERKGGPSDDADRGKWKEIGTAGPGDTPAKALGSIKDEGARKAHLDKATKGKVGTEPTRLAFVDDSVRPDAEYEYRVKAVDPLTPMEATAPAMVKTGHVKPSEARPVQRRKVKVWLMASGKQNPLYADEMNIPAGDKPADAIYNIALTALKTSRRALEPVGVVSRPLGIEVDPEIERQIKRSVKEIKKGVPGDKAISDPLERLSIWKATAEFEFQLPQTSGLAHQTPSGAASSATKPAKPTTERLTVSVYADLSEWMPADLEIAPGAAYAIPEQSPSAAIRRVTEDIIFKDFYGERDPRKAGGKRTERVIDKQEIEWPARSGNDWLINKNVRGDRIDVVASTTKPLFDSRNHKIEVGWTSSGARIENFIKLDGKDVPPDREDEVIMSLGLMGRDLRAALKPLLGMLNPAQYPRAT
jgi:hypothetical protein